MVILEVPLVTSVSCIHQPALKSRCTLFFSIEKLYETLTADFNLTATLSSV